MTVVICRNAGVIPKPRVFSSGARNLSAKRTVGRRKLFPLTKCVQAERAASLGKFGCGAVFII